MDVVNSLSEEEKLKLTVYRGVSELSNAVGADNTYIGKFQFSSEAKALIAEFIWKKMILYAEDLEAFAHHAKRSKVNVEDVKLLFRRNEKILEELNKLENEETEKAGGGEGRTGKRKRSAAGSSKDPPE